MVRADSRRILAEALRELHQATETTRQKWVEALRELHQAIEDTQQKWVEALRELYREAGLDPLTGLPEGLVQAIGWLLIAVSLIMIAVVQIAMWWGR